MNISKMDVSGDPFGIPIPLSRTDTTARSPSLRTVSQIVPSGFGVVGGLRQQVREHLSEPYGVS